MHNEDTVFDNRMSNSEETVVTNTRNNEDTVVETPSHNEENGSTEEPGWTKKDKSNHGKRVAAVAAGTATAAAATAAGMYFTHHDDEAVEAEEPSEDSIAEPTISDSTHTNPNPQPQQNSEPAPEPEPTPEPEPEPTPEPEPEPEPTPEPEPEPNPGVVVANPEVEILGVEVVHTEDGDITLGGMTVDGEEYVLVDVDGGDFDVAWHDDNHDQQIQETELIDISEAHISVNDFAQAANHGNDDTDDYTTPDENLIAENNMDPMNPGEIDYMDTSDTSGFV